MIGFVLVVLFRLAVLGNADGLKKVQPEKNLGNMEGDMKYVEKWKEIEDGEYTENMSEIENDEAMDKADVEYLENSVEMTDLNKKTKTANLDNRGEETFSENMKSMEIVDVESSGKLDENEDLEVKDNASDAWDYQTPNRKGPTRRRFHIVYAADQRKVIGAQKTYCTAKTCYKGAYLADFADHKLVNKYPPNLAYQDFYWAETREHWTGPGEIRTDRYNYLAPHRDANWCLQSYNPRHPNEGFAHSVYIHVCYSEAKERRTFWVERWPGDGNSFHIRSKMNVGPHKACLTEFSGKLHLARCHEASNQRWLFVEATTTTSTSTTTTTPVFSVIMKTFMLPEKIEWKIVKHDKKKTQKVCEGGKYSSWYNEFPTGCVLQKGTYTLHCYDKRGYGWSGGYMKIKKHKLCADFLWEGAEKQVKFIV